MIIIRYGHFKKNLSLLFFNLISLGYLLKIIDFSQSQEYVSYDRK